MNNWRIIIAGAICGIVAESILSEPMKMFYFAPIFLIAVLFDQLPLTIKFLNICIAWLSGTILIFILALVLSDGRIFSFDYFVHLILIITLSSIVIYASAWKK